MSRKWERMVERNRKSVNKVRTKQGIGSIPEGGREQTEVIKGRSWMLPSMLVLLAILYFITTYQVTGVNGTYLFTGFSYIALALLMYWIRRPEIRIAESYLTVRRFTGDKRVEPKDIKELVLNKGHIVIQTNAKRGGRYIYTKMQHRFPMDKLNAKLREFAVKNKVNLKDETA